MHYACQDQIASIVFGGRAMSHASRQGRAAAVSCNSWRQARCSRARRWRRGLRRADPVEWAPRDLDRLIADPKEALDVFDFEPVMKKNVPPAHFGYMATGVDDEMTLRANREGFRKFALRPRRLVDVSNIDMSLELFGAKYDSPVVIAPTGSNRAFHRRRRDRRGQGGEGRQPSANAVHGRDHLDRGRDRRARRAGLVPALHDAALGGRRRPGQTRASRRRAGHRGHARRALAGEMADLRPAAAHRHRAIAAAATALNDYLSRKPNFTGIDLAGAVGTRSPT